MLLGVIVLAVATPALAQTPDPRDPLALYDGNEDGVIDGHEFILAFRDYLEVRIDATLLMRVRELYLSTIVSGSSQPGFWYPACDDYDGTVKDRVIDGDEVLEAVRDYFDEEISAQTVLAVTECYFSTSAHVVRFAKSTYSVSEGTPVAVSLEMKQPYGTSTVNVPIEVAAGGSAGSGDFSFTSEGTDTGGTTATFAASSTRTSFNVYTNRDDDGDDETVILRLGTFSTSTMPRGVFPSTQMGTTTVTIEDVYTPTPTPVSTPTPTPTPIPPTQAPAKVLNLSGTPGSVRGEINLDWDPASRASNYQVAEWRRVIGLVGVYHWVVLDDPEEVTIDVTNTSAVVKGLTGGNTYRHRVRGLTSGNVGGFWSDHVDTTLTPPARVESLGGTPGPGHGEITLTWNGADNATGYQVRQKKPRRLLPDQWVVLPADGFEVVITGTTAVVGNLDPDLTYEHRVRGTNVHGEGEWSASVKTSVQDDRPPTPQGVTPAKTVGYRGIKLSWDRDSTRKTTYYEVETDPTDSYIDISSVKIDGSRRYVEITGLDVVEYEFKVYGVNGTGRSVTPGTVSADGPKPSRAMWHQVDHVAKYDKSAVTNSVIRWSLDDSARKWTAAANQGLEVCDGVNVSCRKTNLDGGVTTVTNPATTRNNTWIGCRNHIACVKDWETDGEYETLTGEALIDLDMIFEDPAYHCARGVRGCGSAAELYVWTSIKDRHGSDYTTLDGKTVLGQYFYIGYATLHELGHTLGLPDFYTSHGAVHWDSRLAHYNAIMNIAERAKNIVRSQDIAQLDAIYIRHKPHRVQNP